MFSVYSKHYKYIIYFGTRKIIVVNFNRIFEKRKIGKPVKNGHASKVMPVVFIGVAPWRDATYFTSLLPV